MSGRKYFQIHHRSSEAADKQTNRVPIINYLQTPTLLLHTLIHNIGILRHRNNFLDNHDWKFRYVITYLIRKCSTRCSFVTFSFTKIHHYLKSIIGRFIATKLNIIRQSLQYTSFEKSITASMERNRAIMNTD